MSSLTVYCRLCAELKPKDKQLDLSTDTVGQQETIAKLVRLRVERLVDMSAKDVLPKTVCFGCYELVDRLSDFLLSVERAQGVLKELFSIGVKEETSDNDLGNLDDFHDDDYPPDEVDEKKPMIVQLKQEHSTDGDKSDGETLALKKKLKTRRKKKKVSSSATITTCLSATKKVKPNQSETWKDYPWVCRLCHAEFTEAQQLRFHADNTHEICCTFKCADCNKRPSSFDNFVRHVKKHRTHLKHCCYLCDEKFDHLKSHMVKVHRFANQCASCGFCFDDEGGLEEHLIKFQKGRVLEKRRKKREPLKKEDLTCNQCDKVFKTRPNLMVHQLIHTERRRDHTCDKCGKTFFNKGTLGSHMLLHDDTRPFKCEICGATFKTVTQLRSHVGIHGGPRPYSCEQCGRSFRLRTHLKSHLIIHTDSMPHTCEFCGKAFRFKTILTQHLRQHTGVKPYMCQACQREFTNWPNYNKHMKRRHGIDTSKKKHTPDGVFPVNPLTGEVQCLPSNNSETNEWKNRIMSHRKPGRPKVNSMESSVSQPIEIGPLALGLQGFPKSEIVQDLTQ